MNRLSTGILLKLGLPIGLILLAALAFRASLQSETTKQRIQESLSNALHMDVRFERLRPTFFKGSRITGLTASREGGSCLSAREVFVRPRLLSLIKGQFVLSDIRVEEARLVLVDAPKTPKQTTSDAKTQAALIKDGRPRLSIRSLAIKNAALDWIDARGKSCLQLEGITLKVSNIGDINGSGGLTVQKGTLYETLPFKDLTAPIHIENDHYTLPNIHAVSGGGSIDAKAEAFASQADMPFSFSGSAKDIDLGRLSEDIPSLQSSGRAHASIELSGLLKKSESFQGKGEALLEDGFLKGFGLLQSIGQVFQISELTNLKIQKANAAFSIANRKITLSELQLSGSDVTISAPGEIDFEQRLNLQAKLSLPEKMLQGKVLQMFSDRFSPLDETGRRSIAFQVAGTVDKPKPNILEKLVGDNVGGVLNKLLGGFLKPKKADPQPQPPAEKTPSPK